MATKHLKVIGCNVFTRELCLAVGQSPQVIDLEFSELGEHQHPDRLRALLQERIDAAEAAAHDYDAVCLAYGLCGNATVGLVARGRPLVLPRAHDCCTILLGSRERFREHFGDNPSQGFSSAGYLDRGDYFMNRDDDGQQQLHYGDRYQALVEQYGEEDARYIWESMYGEQGVVDDCPVFIDVPELAGLGRLDDFRTRCQAEGKSCRVLAGDLRLLRALVAGDWDAAEFLVVPPGQQVQGVYDFEEVVRSSGNA